MQNRLSKMDVPALMDRAVTETDLLLSAVDSMTVCGTEGGKRDEEQYQTWKRVAVGAYGFLKDIRAELAKRVEKK